MLLNTSGNKSPDVSRGTNLLGLCKGFEFERTVRGLTPFRPISISRPQDISRLFLGIYENIKNTLKGIR